MKYLKEFNTVAEYEAAKDGLITPNVSLITETMGVAYKPIHDYSKDYLTFIARESGTYTLTIGSNVSATLLSSVSYSTDEGKTWTTTNNINSQTVTITTPTISAGDKVLWKGSGTSMSVAITGTKAADRPAASSIFSIPFTYPNNTTTIIFIQCL